MKTSSKLIITLFLLCSTSYADDQYVYNGMFNGTPKDDGTNDVIIAHILFHNVQINLRRFIQGQNDPHAAAAAAFLLDSMLQIRAFCEQRAEKITLTSVEKAKLEAIQQALAQLNLSYHSNEVGELSKFYTYSGTKVSNVLVALSKSPKFSAP